MLHLKHLLFFWCSLLFSQSVIAQLSGHISNPHGDPIPFANIYVEGTTHGTSANAEGNYALDLTKGDYKIVFQNIGYQKKVIQTSMTNATQRLNVTLQQSVIEMSEFTIKANAEDPAYPIIRNAIDKRKYFRDQVKSWYSDVYIKGIQQVDSAPKKILGQDIGAIVGDALDSNRRGIVYLSETISKYYVERPDKSKEVLIATKVSGKDNGFGFNRASVFDFSFYDNHINILRQTLSPIGANAMIYYKYRLVGTIKDQKGFDIKKIEVIPKNTSEPVWAGYIYIVDNLWNIQSTDLYLTGASVQNPVLDTLWLRQTHVAVEGQDIWRPISQVIDFKFHILSLHMSGSFSGVFSNYNLHPVLPEGFFNAEVYKASGAKITNQLAYWDSIRPIPLTLGELKDYTKKDSLKVIHESKQFKDSMDKKANHFGVMNLLFGYNHQNSFTNSNWSIGSPLTKLSLNPVQGWNIDLPIYFRKSLDKEGYHWWSLSPELSYGFSEKVLRGSLGGEYRFNGFNSAQLSFSLGKSINQYHSANPISSLLNTLEMLIEQKNYKALYDKEYIRVGYAIELMNGVYLRGAIEGAARAPLDVHYQLNLQNGRDLYSNVPLNTDPTPPLTASKIVSGSVGLTFRFSQKYASYPDHKQVESRGDYPTVTVSYQKAIGLTSNWVDFDKLKIGISEDRIRMGLVGYSELRAEFGTFLSKKILSFVDYEHFSGNQTIVGNPFNYMYSFFQLPYYQYSTTGAYLEAHWQHHFNGFLFDKIPLIKKLGAREIFKVSYLNTPELKHYTELSFGLDNLGFGLFRLFRIDVATHLQQGKWSKPGVVLGLGL